MKGRREYRLVKIYIEVRNRSVGKGDNDRIICGVIESGSLTFLKINQREKGRSEGYKVGSTNSRQTTIAQ